MKQLINMSKNYKAAIYLSLKKTEFQRFKWLYRSERFPELHLTAAWQNFICRTMTFSPFQVSLCYKDVLYLFIFVVSKLYPFFCLHSGALRHLTCLQVLLLFNNQMKCLEETVSELKNMQDLHTLCENLRPPSLIKSINHCIP